MFFKTSMTDLELHTAAGTLPPQDVLAVRAWLMPDQTVFTFVDDAGVETGTLTYRDLWQRATAVASALKEAAEPGERVILFYPAGLDFIGAFMGCLLAEQIAVPVNLPLRRTADRTVKIIEDCSAKVVMAPMDMIDDIRSNFSGTSVDDLTWIASDALQIDEGAAKIPEYGSGIDPDKVAYLQYTSGSTSDPKGVMITYENVITNCRTIRDTLRLDEKSTSVFWQPHHHDMGLICSQLLPIVLGNHTVLMSPNTFVRQPILWLQMMSKYKAEIGGGPNFAFDMTAERFSEAKMEGVDLSNWRLALNGSDVVRKKTMDGFAEVFAPYGYKPETMLVCYGLAEAVLFVSAGPVGQIPHAIDVDADEIELNAKATAIKPSDESRNVVGCGQPSWEMEIAIVDPETLEERAPGDVGEVWLRSRTIGIGYWDNPSATEQTFRGQIAGKSGKYYLRTGDLGFMNPQDKQLYVCGRIKDLIIVSGYNVYPRQIEEALYTCDAVEEATVIGIPHEHRGEVPKAFIKLKDGHSVTEADIQAHLEQKLSKLEWPAEIEFRDALPKTMIGKLSKKELKAEEAGKRKATS
ncbi:MAG: fatty acyl-AMP ligase [Pseudomonadota bacterium]